jgi:hypothetical protein
MNKLILSMLIAVLTMVVIILNHTVLAAPPKEYIDFTINKENNPPTAVSIAITPTIIAGSVVLFNIKRRKQA